MTDFKRILILSLAASGLVAASFFYGYGRGRAKERRDLKPQVDILYVRDTITLSKPVFSTIRIIDTLRVAVRDTIRQTDTLYVQLPMEQKVYEDSTYRAVVSGYRPSLDSISVYRNTTTIRYETITKVKPHWGIGIQSGIGVGCFNGTPRYSPYIGIGVQYNLLTW